MPITYTEATREQLTDMVRMVRSGMGTPCLPCLTSMQRSEVLALKREWWSLVYGDGIDEVRAMLMRDRRVTPEATAMLNRLKPAHTDETKRLFRLVQHKLSAYAHANGWHGDDGHPRYRLPQSHGNRAAFLEQYGHLSPA